MNTPLVTEAEQLVHSLATALTEPQPAECLPCYLDRTLRTAPCDGTLRLAKRGSTAPCNLWERPRRW